MIEHLRGLPGASHELLTDTLGKLYMPCCAAHAPKAEVDPTMDELIDELITYIYTTKGMGKPVEPSVIMRFAREYWNGIVKGYGMDLADADLDSADHKMLSSLRENVWQFSAAKNYSQMRAMGNALIGGDGKLVSFTEFKKAAYAINDAQVGSWLRAEYNLCVAGSQLASKWAQAKADGVPMLEFDVVLDEHTSDICRPLAGVSRPIDDPIWKTYYPPNHFGERTTVREKWHGVPTPDHGITLPDIPKMFQVNLAERGLAFPPDHPYYQGLPDQVKQIATKLATNGKD